VGVHFGVDLVGHLSTFLAMSKSIPRKTYATCELSGMDITLDWNEVIMAADMDEARFRSVSPQNCTGIGHGTCPVGKLNNPSGWAGCTHFPKVAV
jgi:hypothetical protein